MRPAYPGLLTYIAETQDEKMYRVVMDRERWFSVVMGEKFNTDAWSTERLAQRVPLPESLARRLAFRLEVAGRKLPVLPILGNRAQDQGALHPSESIPLLNSSFSPARVDGSFNLLDSLAGAPEEIMLDV
jgi:hypothetical protein